MTHEDYVTYDLAKALKAAGFDWPCRRYYTKENAADDDVWMTGCMQIDDWNNPPLKAAFILHPICSAPTLAVAAKWLREVQGFYVQVRINGIRDMYSVEIWETKANGYYLKLTHPDEHVRLFDSYEDALTAGLTEALKLLNDK